MGGYGNGRKRQMRGSLRYATDDEAVGCFGRDDASLACVRVSESKGNGQQQRQHPPAKQCLLLFDDAAGAVGDQGGEVGGVFAEFSGGDFFAHGGEGFGGVELGGLEEFVGGSEFFELGGGEAL